MSLGVEQSSLFSEGIHFEERSEELLLAGGGGDFEYDAQDVQHSDARHLVGQGELRNALILGLSKGRWRSLKTESESNRKTATRVININKITPGEVEADADAEANVDADADADADVLAARPGKSP